MSLVAPRSSSRHLPDLTDTETEKLTRSRRTSSMMMLNSTREVVSSQDSYFDASDEEAPVLEAEEIEHDGTLVEATEEDAPVLSESMQRYADMLGKVANAPKQL